jgi:hypothetical protein
MMNPKQQRAFEIYVGLESKERSIAKLALALAAMDTPIPESTLKSWSVRYDWANRLIAADTEIARRLSDAMVAIHVDRVTKDLTKLDKIKETITGEIERQLEAGAESQLNLLELMGAYERIIRLQGGMVKAPPSSPTDKQPDGPMHPSGIVLTDAQLQEILQKDIQERQGLPAPRNVTPAEEVA